MEEYGSFLFKAKTEKITPIKGGDLQITANEMRESAAGLDNWAPAELKMVPLEAYDKLAVLFNMIEAGAPWPKDMMKARAAFLAKDPGDEQNPLAYSVLLMLSGHTACGPKPGFDTFNRGWKLRPSRDVCRGGGEGSRGRGICHRHPCRMVQPD